MDPLKRPHRVGLGGFVLVLGMAWCVPGRGQAPLASAPSKGAPGAIEGRAAGQDPVKLSFLFMGCNRIQHSDWKKIKDDDPSSANLPQFRQTAQDIAGLDPTPAYLFFTGDLVVNLEDDRGEKLKKQLDAWTELFNASPLAAKLTLIPLPGNHEMLRKLDDDKDDEDKVEVPNSHVDPIWVQWLHKSHFDTFARRANGPRAGHPEKDHLADDQSELTYSFDVGDIHFVVVNTDSLTTIVDPETKKPYIGWIPYHWIEKDIQAAQADSRVSAIFVLGHKPITIPKAGEEDTIINTRDHPLADKLKTLLAANDKVRGYLCAHEHAWDRTALDSSGKVWQVVAGNAGSQLNSSFLSGTPFFGFSRINVYLSGKVGLVSYQRPANKDKTLYIAGPPTPPPPAQPQPEIILYPPP